MGGYGSGRYTRYDAKWTVEHSYCLPISLFRPHLREARRRVGRAAWSRDGREVAAISYLVEPGKGVRLMYTTASGTREERLHDCMVHVTTTTPHFGGTRYWWICPGCGRCCHTLHGMTRYLCRLCHGLTYRSCQRSHYEAASIRTIAHAEAFLARLEREGKP